MKRLVAFFRSMTGRVFVIMIFGMVISVFLAGFLSSLPLQMAMDDYQADYKKKLEPIADQLNDFIARLERSSSAERAALLDGKVAPGIAPLRLATPPRNWVSEGASSALKSALVSRGVLGAETNLTSPVFCEPSEELNSKGNGYRSLAKCVLVKIKLGDGSSVFFAVTDPPYEYGNESGKHWFLLFSLLALGLGSLAYLIARITGAPLKRLAAAAVDLGGDLDRKPIPVAGTTEVRRAAQAFNTMQQRIQKHLGERTHMLAAISHDLQTPLTRMRLRLEKVEEGELRDKLVADVSAMQALIREGLELARSTETSEQAVPLDLDSLLESLVEDAADAGGQATFVQGCRSVLNLRPLAVKRLFSNLIDNALKYAGAVEVLATRERDGVMVCIRDRGPGLPDDQLETVFEPFRRIESSRSRDTGGSGLGLTIARTLAETNGATLVLRNRAGGGLEALVRWPERFLAS